jgi:hypothetical protein
MGTIFYIRPFPVLQSDDDSLRTFREGLVDEIKVAASLASSESVVSMRRQFDVSFQGV